MKNRLINLICVSFLISSSPALSDNHLDHTPKFQDGEKYANCVYGPGAEVTVKQEFPGAFGATEIVDQERHCGSGWEGAFLYQAFVKVRMNLASTVWDLQTAYNCCVHTDDPRSKVCDEMGGRSGTGATFFTSWGQCAEYFGTMLGNVANVLPVIQQPEANEAVKMACIRAISGRGDFNNGEDWLINTDYHNRDDKLFEDCFKEEYLSKAAPYVFDYLRDYTGCLWNNPDDRFCSGSRRRMPGTPFGWENDR
jgi:hypothetical protein